MKHPRIAYLGVPLLLLACGSCRFVARRSPHLPRRPEPLDRPGHGHHGQHLRRDHEHHDGSAPIDNCLTTAAPGNTATHTHTAHLVIQNVEDLVGWQVRMNYLGDQMRPSTFNSTPFTDNITGQTIGFVNLPIDQATCVHRGVSPRHQHPGRSRAGPQTALIGAVYNGAQNFPISPDTPAKAVPDDTSYYAPPAAASSPPSPSRCVGNSRATPPSS